MSLAILSLVELQAFVASASVDAAILDVEVLYQGPLLHFDNVEQTSHLGFGKLVKVHSASEVHVVVVSALADERFVLACGDQFYDGRLAASTARERVSAMDAPEHLKLGIMELHGRYPRSHQCGFLRMWLGERKLCSHITAALASLAEAEPRFEASLVQQRNAVADPAFMPAAPAALPTILTLEELSFKVPVLVEGERGGGKTFEARELAERHNAKYVEFAGHEGIETIDLLGRQAQYGAEWVWMDGALSEAFRMAQHGRVVLLLDELLRVRIRELSILLTALSAHKGKYRLTTGRVVGVTDGVGKSEVLECPCENLWVVGTTNVGFEYAVDECDPALRERFVVRWKDSSEETMKPILLEMTRKKGFDDGVVDKVLKFHGMMRTAKRDSKVKDLPTTRTLTRALALANRQSDVVRALRSHQLLWVGRTAEGVAQPEHLATVERLLGVTLADV